MNPSLMEMNVIVGLLTAAVVLLSVVILALLASLVIVLLKVRHVINNINTISGNVASLTTWFSPTKVLREARKFVKR